MANSTFTITFTFTDTTSGLADTKRDNALKDFALLSGLDIWTDGTHTVVDATKVAPAIRAFVYAAFRAQVIAYRAQSAANAARATAEFTEGAAL